jgi:hypothetical protein
VTIPAAAGARAEAVLLRRSARKGARGKHGAVFPPSVKTNMDAGHHGASGRYDRLREIAFEYAFVLTRCGAGR